MVASFIFHESEITITKDLFAQFNQTYPEESRAFLWAFDASPNLDVLSYMIIAILTFLVFLSLNLVFFKINKKHVVADFVNIFVYLGLFILFSFFLSPLILDRPVNLIWALGYSIVIGASTHLCLLHDHLREKRRNTGFESKQSKSQLDFILHSLELEHVEYRSLLHDIIWVCVSLSVGLFLGTALQYLFSLPMEIALSNTFGIYMSLPFVQYVILIVGVFLGIIFQLLTEIHDIVDLIREKAKSPIEVESEKQQEKKSRKIEKT